MTKYKQCGYSVVGESHKARGTVCQDSSFVGESNGVIVAVVADGLSSSAHSEIASKIATEAVSKYCFERITSSTDSQTILTVLRGAFDEALFRTKHHVKSSQGDMKDYDTTLSAVVFISGAVYFGHVGDSGIVALDSNGIFEQVTIPQNGEGVGKDRPTYTLQHINKWCFEQYPREAKALFLCTDGVLNKLMPPLLADRDRKFDNRYLIYLFKKMDAVSEGGDINKWIKDEVNAIGAQECGYDDKSLIIVASDDVMLTTQPEEYYIYPSDELWAELLLSLKRRLYPYRYPADTAANVQRTPNTTRLAAQDRKPTANKKLLKARNKRVTLLAASVLCIALLVFLGVFITKLLSGESGGNQKGFKAAVKEAVASCDTSFEFDGKPHGIEFELEKPYDNAKITYGTSKDETKFKESVTLTNVGTSQVYYRVSCKGYKDIEGSLKLTITPFDFSRLAVKHIAPQKYQATEIKPEITLDNSVLEEGVDYSVSYMNNINAGKAKVIIQSRNDNCKGTLTLEFTISKATPTLPDILPKYTIDVGFDLPTDNSALGINDVSIPGELIWYTDIACTYEASSRDLPKKPSEPKTLFYRFKFTDNTPEDYKMNYDEIWGSATFWLERSDDNKTDDDKKVIVKPDRRREYGVNYVFKPIEPTKQSACINGEVY